VDTGGVHGVVAHAGVVIGDEVDDLVALPPELVRVEEPGVVLWLRGSRFHREDNVVLCGASAIVFCYDESQRHC